MANSAISATVQATVYNGNWYGVSGKPAVASPDLTRIGSDMDYHADLPIHSLMKACLVNDDGSVNYYLDPTDWTKKVGGAASNLDGTDGQVMIEIPEHYYLDWDDLDVQRFGISLDNISGWNHFPKSYVGAYKAVAQRSTKKLCSIVNTGTDYRGGNNDATNDANEKTLLGRCVTMLPIQSQYTDGEDFRTYAQNRGSIWHPITWKLRSAIVRFFIVEYATKNSQKAVDGTLTAEGYKKGGLGNGVTDVSIDLDNDKYPFIAEGQANSLASASGEVSYLIPIGATQTVKIPRYRGIENIFGYIMEYNEGLVVKHDGDNNLRRVYFINNPSDFTCTDETKGELIATINDTKDKIIETVLNNYLIPLTANGLDFDANFCDIAQLGLSNESFVYLHVRSCGYNGGGVAYKGNGLFWMKSEDWCYMAVTYISTRLCCHPNGY